MDAQPGQDPALWIHKNVLSPLVLAMTTLAFGECVIEAMSRGHIRPLDPLTDLYLTLLAGYVSGVEIRKWAQKNPPDPAQDPWLEKAQRSGFLVWIWWGLYLAIHLWQFHDATVVMPTDLKAIAKAVILLLIGKHVSRYVRHTRRGVGGEPSGGGTAIADSSSADRLIELLNAEPEGYTFQEIETAVPEISRSHLARLLKGLVESKKIERVGIAHTRSARYKVIR